VRGGGDGEEAGVQVLDRLWIGGEWVEPEGSGTIEVVDPATEQVVATVPEGTAGDIDRAVTAARKAWPGWAATPLKERVELVARLADVLEARADEMARLISEDMGAPVRIARAVQVGTPLAVLRSMPQVVEEIAFTEEVGNSLVVREPVGVVGAITPWNYPLHQVTAKVAPALVAGCTVVLKPSEVAPRAAFLLAELLDSVGLPAGVVNVVTGYGPVVGEALAAHPEVEMVSFTGSTAAGKRVSAVAAGTVKRVSLELGGKSANVVLPDVDDEMFAKAVKSGVANCFLNSGQTCTAWTRLLVPADRYDDAVEMAAAAASKFSVGPPTDPDVKLGPLASEAQRDRVRGYLRTAVEEGARVAAGGPDQPEGREEGFYIRPTVLADVTPTMTVAREEIFGPVLSVLAYADEDEAAAIAAGTDYGLAGGVWSPDPEHAVAFARRMRTGQVDVNGGRFNPLAPFGGYKQSGNGRELGRYGVEEFLEVTSIQR
jgi:aldehyde dehydrogenase (NAD+)